ncbi:MOSC domain-containing protein [Seonamhaeicola sp. MEBiC1930]|uniref:MOSC domain-containing protein n=1 Tax=Seonamhaeicola sp. MEBiC01930 TaxID=2976768 RepID=UPI0032561756
MKIISTNIAKPKTIIWNGNKVVTGIYKTPTNQSIFLGKSDVKGDEITDRKNHGGEFKACYIFSENQYSYWKNLYPDLDWKWGMFGENITVSGLNENEIFIGDIYKVGNALVQVTQPREPCFKLGYKFGNQNVLKQFIAHGFPGTYVRIIEEGYVKSGDEFKLVERPEKSLTTAQLFKLLFDKDKNKSHIDLAINNNALPQRKRNKLKSFLS